MDITQLSTEKLSREGSKMPLVIPGTKNTVVTHPVDGQEKPREMYLMLLGPDSEKTRRVLKRIRVRSQNERDGDLSDDEIEADKRNDAMELAKLVVGGCVYFKGAWHEADAAKDVAYDVFMTVSAFRGQAASYIIDSGNYLEA